MSLIKTHPNFKSIIPSVQNAEKMNDYLGEVLYYQYTFERGTTRWEMQQWDYDDLQAFEIDLERVDRLYHINFVDDCGDRRFEMIGRMQCKEESFYVQLFARRGFHCKGGGYMFISRDANLFMKYLLKSKIEKDLIYKALADDGIEVEEEELSEFESVPQNPCQYFIWKNLSGSQKTS